MALQLKVISDNKVILGDDCTRLFGEKGGTIGRALQNDWILPDPERFISSCHATIDYHGGAYYLADTSSNGVYVNDEDEPLGKGNPRRLFDGDRLCMGSFEFLVTLKEGQGLEMPPPPPPSVVPDHIAQLVPEEIAHSSIMLLDEEEITGDDAFRAAIFGVTGKHETKKKPAPTVKNPQTQAPENPRTQEAEKLQGISAAVVVESFLNGAGISHTDIHPSVDPLELMSNAGQILRELVGGLNELLICRTNLKTMFSLDQTTVLPRHNNPLKLSDNTTEAVKQLLVGKEGEYLGPMDSVTEVFHDLQYHHDAVVGGMTGAMREMIGQFDPIELQKSFDASSRSKSLFDAVGKLKYWKQYCDLYPSIVEPGEGDLPVQFTEEFVRHYEKHIADSKRAERDGGNLKSTISMSKK